MGSLAVVDKTGVDAGAHEPQQYLTFQVGDEVFALGILAIREIIEFGRVSGVPQMPDFVRGVINLRGAVVPVVDLGARFGKDATPVTRRTCVVIVEMSTGEGARVMGVMVDAVNEVLEIPAHEVEPPPSFGSQIRSEFISGMGKVEGHFVIILDIEHVLSLDEVAALGARGNEDPSSIASRTVE